MAQIPVVRARRSLTPVLLALLVLAVVAVGVLWPFQPEPEPPPSAAEPAPEGFLDGGAGFAVQVDDLAIPYDTFAVTALPGDTLRLEALFVTDAEAGASDGTLTEAGPRRWQWTAPATPGLSRIEVTSAEDETIALNAFTLVPFDHESETIGDYRIGDYEDEPLDGSPAYEEPPGFVRVTRELADVDVAPHFELGQFLAKQEADWPKYLVLSPTLLLKLERILFAVNEAGVEAHTLSVLSGYRTPAYNAAIGNETSFSRHVYGDAADVFVDADGDGVMDDVTGDGVVTEADAEWLAAVVEDLSDQPWYAPFVGGLGIYGPAPHRGPFIHVDTRGEPVRW